MENRKRNIQMKFYVTEEEKRLIDEKMKQLPIKQYGAYFRKMAIDGYILVVDRSDTKAYIRELQAVSRNINQRAITQCRRSMKINIISGTTIACASSNVLCAKNCSTLSTSSKSVVLICPGERS